MDVVLVPGLWLDASSWHDVAARLAAAGHAPHALTLRGLHSRTADRTGIMLADHVAEIVDAIDRCSGPVAVVGHAEACGLVHAAVNRRPDRIARAIHVGGFPSADGTHVLTGCRFDGHGHAAAAAEWCERDPALRMLQERSRENGTHVVDGLQRLTDERRFDVPTTVVATEFRTEDIRRWMREGADPALELTRMTDLTLVDLPAGRWPQIECSAELSELLLACLPATAGQPATA